MKEISVLTDFGPARFFLTTEEVLTNAGGHYNANTSSFICPWDGVYLVSINMESFDESMRIELMQNDVVLARISLDVTSGDRGSTTIVIECNRGDVVWVRTVTAGLIHGDDRRNMFTGHILCRYQGTLIDYYER